MLKFCLWVSESDFGLFARFCGAFIALGYLVAGVVTPIQAQSRYKDVDQEQLSYLERVSIEHRFSMLEADNATLKESFTEFRHLEYAMAIAMAGLVGEAGLRVAKTLKG
jgi:hypothetical protein